MATYYRVFYCRHRKAFFPGALCISGPTPLAPIAKPVPFRSDSDSDHASVAFSGQWTTSLPCFSRSYSRALKSIPEVNGPLLLHLSERTRIQHLELSGSDGSERKAFVAATLTKKTSGQKKGASPHSHWENTHPASAALYDHGSRSSTPLVNSGPVFDSTLMRAPSRPTSMLQIDIDVNLESALTILCMYIQRKSHIEVLHPRGRPDLSPSS